LCLADNRSFGVRAIDMAFVLVWLITATVSAQEAPVESVRQLHDTMIKPASDAIFNVAREAPKSVEAWTAVAGAGLTLSKSGQLMMLQAPASKREKWITLSRQLTLIGRTAQRAAEARNLEALTHASDRLIVVCETCHAPYRNRSSR
jgi:hypothetical protein